MTMNENNRPAASSAPLDLRTTDRERVSGGARTADCKGHGRSGCVADATGARGDAPPERLGNGVRSAAERRHAASVSPSPSDCARPGRLSAVRDSDAPGGRASDKSSSSLPFRKRRFPAEPESRSPAPSDAGHGSPSADLSLLRSSPKGFRGPADENDVPRRAAGAVRTAAHGYPRGPVQTYIPYCQPVVYPVCCLPPVSVPHHISLRQHAQHSAYLLDADVALATFQDDDGDTALHIAVAQGDEAVVCMLINLLLLARRDLNVYNNLRQTPLHLAVITHQAYMVEALLKAGADPSFLDRNGQTALHLCCEYGQQDCLAVVLSYLPSPTCLDFRNFEGLSSLHLAVQGGWKDLAKMLLNAGADINAMDNKSGQSPVMHAVESNNIDMVRFLIENGCDVNSQAYSGNTALHSACGRGQVDTVRVLLKSGADSSLKNYHNDTPIMVAKDKKITDVLRGKVFKQTRSQDQQCLSVSPQRSNLKAHESPSPSHSL
ncbi:B-cell lymphoma 3 protein homolog [Lampris incognitus]|uniref:B-cell lymphoma 3 protein homolog n=1 Tax=Lampris incognitus TaxID=2546036 RepID=UPI0024B5216E|nr:B-cell lymphoma 3 protein homolog [Lampris incognitus]